MALSSVSTYALLVKTMNKMVTTLLSFTLPSLLSIELRFVLREAVHVYMKGGFGPSDFLEPPAVQRNSCTRILWSINDILWWSNTEIYLGCNHVDNTRENRRCWNGVSFFENLLYALLIHQASLVLHVQGCFLFSGVGAHFASKPLVKSSLEGLEILFYYIARVRHVFLDCNKTLLYVTVYIS